MRNLVLLLAAALLAAPATAQVAGGKPGAPYESKRYQVRISGPEGWERTLVGPKPAGTWVDLVRYTEPRTKATALLSVVATQYRSAEEMIDSLTLRFEKDAALAVLRREVRAATAHRPKGVLFEYTTQARGGPVHMLAVYYLHLGNRFRVLGTVKEAAWRTVGPDLEKFAGALTFTGRLFSEQVQNFTDEPQNFSLYYPEDWTVKLPLRGPRVAFTSARLGVGVWVYVAGSVGTLAENVDRTIRALERARGKVIRRDPERKHPALGVKTVVLEYTKPSTSGKKYFYREVAILHRDRYYRFSLVGTGNAVKAAQALFEKMVATISFLQ